MRKSGILLAISSLPSDDAIGTMGKPAYDFIDFLVKAGQAYWQILPVGPTSFGDSPYQSFSTFAGNPYFIDLDLLAEEGLLLSSEYEKIDYECTADCVNYGVLYKKRFAVLGKAVERFLQAPSDEFCEFCTSQDYWVEDYALFMALKEAHDGASWLMWEEELRRRDGAAMEAARTEYADRIQFWRVVQFFFKKQWIALRAYADEKGISIIGDLPIYVALDSADVWAKPWLFQLDENLEPTDVAGCPPDAFAEGGQLWGNPLFNWDRMREDDYAWWITRIWYACQTYHVLRIDHFRGFDSYYAIPYGDKDARRGEWRQGPGIELFRAMDRHIGRQRIIAEDLGFLTDSVRNMLAESGFPGMKILEMAFDSREGSGSDYLPHRIPYKSVAYIGTHDNHTVYGWLNTAFPGNVAMAKDYLGLSDEKNYHWEMMKALWGTIADLAIVQAQDLLGLGEEARMNTPSTLGGNWVWRAKKGDFDDALAEKLMHYMKLYGRLYD